MIYGIGTDLVFVPRIADAMQRFGVRFSNKILTQAEQLQLAQIAKSDMAARYVAKRFAAKEAYAKALGTGVGGTFSWHDVAISNDKNGKPRCVASKNISAHLASCGIKAAHISIADEQDYVLAFVTLETA